MDTWIQDELTRSNLGDKRLNRRYAFLLKRLAAKPSLSIPAACQGWSEVQAGYRFLSNHKVNKDNLLEPHIQSTQQRLGTHPVVLCVEDTSS